MIRYVIAFNGLIGILLTYRNRKKLSKVIFIICWMNFNVSMFYGVLSNMNMGVSKRSNLVELLLIVVSLLGIALVLATSKINTKSKL